MNFKIFVKKKTPLQLLREVQTEADLKNAIREADKRIRYIDEHLLPDAEDALAQAIEGREGYINLQPPRHHKVLWESWEREKGGLLKEKLAALKAERSQLLQAIKRAERVKNKRKQAEAEALAKKLQQRAKALIERAQAKAEAIRLVLELDEVLKGQSLREAFFDILKTPAQYQDLQTQRHWLEKEHGLLVEELPEFSEKDVLHRLKKAIEQLAGNPLHGIKGSRRWRSIANEQRASDADRAARAVIN